MISIHSCKSTLKASFFDLFSPGEIWEGQVGTPIKTGGEDAHHLEFFFQFQPSLGSSIDQIGGGEWSLKGQTECLASANKKMFPTVEYSSPQGNMLSWDSLHKMSKLMELRCISCIQSLRLPCLSKVCKQSPSILVTGRFSVI